MSELFLLGGAFIVFIVGYLFGWAGGKASGKVEAYEDQAGVNEDE